MVSATMLVLRKSPHHILRLSDVKLAVRKFENINPAAPFWN